MAGGFGSKRDPKNKTISSKNTSEILKDFPDNHVTPKNPALFFPVKVFVLVLLKPNLLKSIGIVNFLLNRSLKNNHFLSTNDFKKLMLPSKNSAKK